MTRKLLSLTLISLLTACSVETEDEAKQKCRDLVNDWCKTWIACLVDQGDIAAADEASEISSCKQTGESAIDCGAAVRTSDNYDSCMDAVHATQCSSVDANARLPSQCSAVIELSK